MPNSGLQLLDPSHDLADERRQQSLSRQLEEVIFIAAAIDCSTKSRAREIPRRFEDGRPAPGPPPRRAADSSLWYCTPWWSVLTFFAIDTVFGSSTTLPQS